MEANEKGLKPPRAQLEEAPNLSQIDRSYWLSGNPLPVTSRTSIAARRSSMQRCVGCHGLKGDGKGPAAPFMSPPPADFTDKDDACCGGDTGPGDFYFRILRGWPGTAMENFGDRLCVDDIWRVVLFVKTIPNGTLHKNTSPDAERLHRLAALEGAARLGEDAASSSRTTSASTKEQSRDPFMQEAMRVFPGLAPGDTMVSTTARPGCRSRTRPPASRRSTRTCSIVRGPRREHAARSCRAEVQKRIPPTVPGQQ